MHLTRLRRFTEPSKRLSPTALCGQVMASVSQSTWLDLYLEAWESTRTFCLTY